MPDKIEILTMIMGLVEKLEELIAQNELVLAGLVTDPQVVRESLYESNEFLKAALAGHKLTVAQDPEMNRIAAITFDTMLDRN